MSDAGKRISVPFQVYILQEMKPGVMKMEDTGSLAVWMM